MELKTKQPAEVTDFDVDFTKELADGDSLADIAAFYTGPDDALYLEKATPLDYRAKLWFSSGTDKATYKVTGYGVTVQGRVIEFEFQILVRDN